MRKILFSTLLGLVLAVTSAGCFGKFALTRKIYDFNDNVSGNKFVRSVAMWAMVIIPVYEVGAVADFLVLNTIEFWTGSNPIAANEQCDGTKRLAVVEQPDGSATLECGEATYRLVPSGTAGFALERNGIRIGTAQTTDDGGLLVLDPQGNILKTLSAAEVDARAADAVLLASNP
jgi:hypothetical protein